MLISPQCRLQILGIDVVIFNGGACSDTQGCGCPPKGRMDMAFERFFICFHHIGAGGQSASKPANWNGAENVIDLRTVRLVMTASHRQGRCG